MFLKTSPISTYLFILVKQHPQAQDCVKAYLILDDAINPTTDQWIQWRKTSEGWKIQALSFNGLINALKKK